MPSPCPPKLQSKWIFSVFLLYWFSVRLSDCPGLENIISLFKMSRDVTKSTNWPVRPAKTQIRLGGWSVFAVRSMGSQGFFICGQGRPWLDWADSQAYLSLRWAHTPFCWFCHDAAHYYLFTLLLKIMICWIQMYWRTRILLHDEFKLWL